MGMNYFLIFEMDDDTYNMVKFYETLPEYNGEESTTDVSIECSKENVPVDANLQDYYYC